MKLLVGRFVLLGCISAVLVVANADSEKPVESSPFTTQNVSLIDLVTEKVIKSSPEVNQRIELSETTSSPDKNSKIFSNPNVKEKNIEREIVVIHDQSSGGVGGGHHDHGYHDHHEHDHHHEHDYHHPPPARPPPPHHHHDHHHPPPPPHHHHYPPAYPGYYPPYAPPYPHGMHQPYAGGVAMPPPYPYYPAANYYNSPPKKSSATIIQTSSTTSSQNYPKPTDLLNQGTEYLWNLFGKLGAITGENHHEVVLINPKPVASATPVQMLPPSWYANANKGKIVPNNDCNNKND